MSWLTPGTVIETTQRGEGRLRRTLFRVRSNGSDLLLDLNVAQSDEPEVGERLTLVRNEGGRVIGFMRTPLLNATEMSEESVWQTS